MILLDANVLIYAYNAVESQHEKTKKWLDDVLASSEWIGLPWVTAWAFLRISTNPRAFRTPLSREQAFQIVNDFLNQPQVTSVEPGAQHLEILRRLAADHQIAGPLMTDAVLAALALEHGADLASTDQGFSRFKTLRWRNPLSES